VALTKSPNPSHLNGSLRSSGGSPAKPISVIAALVLSVALPYAGGCSRGVASEPSISGSRAAVAQARKAARTKEETAREELEQIPPPSKTRYLDVRSKDAYDNPFIEVHPNTVSLTIIFPDQKPEGFASGSMLRPMAARRQQVDVLLADLPEALSSLPPEVWPYGRVVGITEPAAEQPSERVAIRRNVEATIQMLNDLGVVADEWNGSSGALLR
jgi:hypothetical protein